MTIARPQWGRPLVLACSLTAMVACRDASAPVPAEIATDQRSGAVQEAGGAITHEGALPRFSIELALQGSAALGAPLRIEALLRGEVATAAAGLSIALPELVASQSDGWLTSSLTVFPAGVELAPALRTVFPLATGETVRRGANVMITEPGYYQVVATAWQESDEIPIENGRHVQGFIAKEMFLFVDERGARLTGAFDESLLPPAALGVPGPFRTLAAAAIDLVPCETDPTLPDCQPPEEPPPGPEEPPPAPAEPAYFRALFGEPQAGGSYLYRGLPQALVTYRTPLGTFTTRTDDDGRYVISPCPTGNQRFIVDITYQHPDVMIAHPAGLTYQAIHFEAGREACNRTQDHVALDRKSHIWANMIKLIPASRAFFGVGRGAIKVYYDPDPAAGSHYDPAWDRIVIGYEDVLGEYGRFVAAHEYGHALHEKALGTDHGGNCPVPHYFEEQTGLRCAFSEGFATYHAVAAYPSPRYYVSWRVETPSRFTDGALAGQAVAAFLYDLTDPPNEVHDAVQYPGSYVAGLIRDCDRATLLKWSGADGIDVIIYCAELAAHTGIDPDTRNSLPTRSPVIQRVREQQTEPGGATQKADVERLWRWNLYGGAP